MGAHFSLIKACSGDGSPAPQRLQSPPLVQVTQLRVPISTRTKGWEEEDVPRLEAGSGRGTQRPFWSPERAVGYAATWVLPEAVGAVCPAEISRPGKGRVDGET